MPILQSRMIALINAALDYQQGFAAMRQTVLTQANAAKRGAISAEDALTNIESYVLAPNAFLQQPVDSARTLAVEEHHFRTHARDNRRAAKRAAERRGRGEAWGTTTGTTHFVPDPADREWLQPAVAGRGEETGDGEGDDGDNGSAAVNLAWDETDPENAFGSGADLGDLLRSEAPRRSSALRRSSLTPEQMAHIDLEAEAYAAPEGHETEVADGKLWCHCSPRRGMELEEWREHLAGGRVR